MQNAAGQHGMVLDFAGRKRMSPQPADLQRLLDRAAIHDVISCYFQGIDRGNPAQVRACFTEDARAQFEGRPATQGVDALIKSINAFSKQISGEWKVTTHFMGNLNFNRVESDDAETETYAFACLVLTGTPHDQVALRSLRYLDRLRRTTGGWKICERLHTLDWRCEVPAGFAVSMRERVMQRPGASGSEGGLV
jgi:SnoaL-like domain